MNATRSKLPFHAEIDLAEVRRLLREHLSGLPVRIYLFGSFARGTLHRGSDIDVAVWSEQPIDRERWIALRDALESANILFRVDLVDLSEADPVFRERVFREGIPWN
jgi:predicted nucleotidyltransferase